MMMTRIMGVGLITDVDVGGAKERFLGHDYRSVVSRALDIWDLKY